MSPSKFSRSKKGSSSFYHKSKIGFSLNEDEDFRWLDYKFTISMSILLITIHFLSGIIFNGDIFLSVPNDLVRLFALNNYLVLTDLNESYRMLTSLLIHGSIFHLGGNLLFFLIFSIRLEEIKGWKVALTIFIIGGLAGNILTLLVFGVSSFTSLGASGAVNGVFCANLVAMRKEYNKGSLSALFFLIFFASFTIAGPNSNFFSHFGGLIGGGLTMYYLDKYLLNSN